MASKNAEKKTSRRVQPQTEAAIRRIGENEQARTREWVKKPKHVSRNPKQ